MLILINGLATLALLAAIVTTVPILVGYVVTSLIALDYHFVHDDDRDVFSACGFDWVVGAVTLCIIVVVLIAAWVVGTWVTPPVSLG